jgi:hypothetical protein
LEVIHCSDFQSSSFYSAKKKKKKGKQRNDQFFFLFFLKDVREADVNLEEIREERDKCNK